VHITTRQRLNEFAPRYSETSSALEYWYREVKRRNFRLFVKLRSVFPTAGHVGQLMVFYIGGNRACLVTAIREWNE
jgi:mRNA-degrading endonuclease HigB of HigAB toxin-antitoxin module